MTWRDAALQDAKDRDPWESVGLVVVVKGRERYWPCRNMSHNMQDMFVLNPEDYHIMVVDQEKEEEFKLQGDYSATKKLDGIN